MDFTKNLRLKSSGQDVFYIKNKLFDLGYYDASIKQIKSLTFGNDTDKAVRAFQKKNVDKNGKKLKVDGVIGILTWQAIEELSKEGKEKVKYTRLIKHKMSGTDVRYMKDCLFKLKYYANHITKITNNTYGNDTLVAVKSFQSSNKLKVDSIIGPLTWNAIVAACEGEKTPDGLLKDYKNIFEGNRKLIERDLIKVTPLRQKIVLELLKYCYDKDQKGDPNGLYIWGGNLYNTDLRINTVTEAKINNSRTASTAAKTWMKSALRKNSKLPGSDCSGMIVGMLRKHKLVTNTFDRTANGLSTDTKNSTKIAKSALQSGDWVARDGHIGVYVGGGFVVEFYGSSYGCQLTKLDKRQGYDFTTKTIKNGSAWSRYRKPTYY